MMNYDMAPSIARSDSFNISTYELDLDVTAYTYQQLVAHATIGLEVLDATAQDLWFDLVELTVDSIRINGFYADHAQTESQLHVELPEEGWQTGTDYEIEVWYQGSPYQDPYWGGFYFVSDYIYNLGIGLTTIPPNFGKVWYPCFDNFVERAAYTYHVTSAGGRRAHCQGTLIGETFLGGDTLTRSFELTHPITTHQSAIAVAPYVDSNYVHTGNYGDIPVRLTGKPEQINAMANKFQELGYAIDALEYWWGPYAWERVGYVLTTDGALEIPTNIAYPQFMVGEGLVANGDLFSHELGHHWWGDLVAPTIHNHMWLKEGPAEYSSHLFVEWKDGPEEFVEVVKDNQQFVLEECHLQDNGFYPLSPMPDEEIYGRHTYYKGASIVHNLRAYLGDELFRSSMQSVIAEHFDSHMDAAVFEQTLEDITGVDMTPWFEAQVLQPGFSTWVLDSSAHESGSNASTLYLQQKLRACENYHMAEPLDVTVWDDNWNRFDTQISANGQFDEITVEHPGIDAPAYIALNANGKLNQGRLDFMYTITEPEGIQNLPWVEMRVGCDAMPEGDSALVRIEHHWAAPDQGPVEPYVDQLSNTHFWVVDGIWPEGTLLDARMQYFGNSPEGLDYELYGDTEANGFLAWRPDASSPWQECTAYEWQPGSLTNGSGLFRVSDLKKGQYAFAKGDVSAHVAEAEVTPLRLWPNPTSETLNISSTAGIAAFQIFNAKGQQVANASNVNASNALKIDVSKWAKGWYVFESARGDSQRFMVE
ncbi:MAG: T9SS type A sorting domain-containing protein [Flavobacteriales bacterium]|nr:T9SS type A sorting domain-containing protein [Flavobacteriales bacterium]